MALLLLRGSSSRELRPMLALRWESGRYACSRLPGGTGRSVSARFWIGVRRRESQSASSADLVPLKAAAAWLGYRIAQPFGWLILSLCWALLIGHFVAVGTIPPGRYEDQIFMAMLIIEPSLRSQQYASVHLGNALFPDRQTASAQMLASFRCRCDNSPLDGVAKYNVRARVSLVGWPNAA